MSSENSQQSQQNSIQLTEDNLFKNSPPELIPAQLVKSQRDTMVQKQIERKECRICLQGQEGERILQPCLCSGSISYTHEKCLSQWIHKKQYVNKKTKVNCEMCHHAFSYKVARKRKMDCQKLRKNYEKQKTAYHTFITASIILLIALGFIIFILVSYQTQEGIFSQYIKAQLKKQNDSKTIWVCALFVIFIILFFIVTLFLIEHGITSELVIHEIKNYEPAPIKRYKLHPRHK